MPVALAIFMLEGVAEGGIAQNCHPPQIPDVAVYAGGEPAEEVPAQPPYIAVEILSPDDRMTSLMAKLREYLAWGVPHIWLVDPLALTLAEYTAEGLRESPTLRLPEYDLEVTATDLFPSP